MSNLQYKHEAPAGGSHRGLPTGFGLSLLSPRLRFGPVACVLLGWAGFAYPAFAQEPDIVGLEEQAIAAAVANVAPCVVRIDTVGGLERVEDTLLGDGPTTGMIVSKDGFIISSAFNFLRQPSAILVTMPDGQRLAAEIVARDGSRMLVLLRVNVDSPLPVPEAVPRDQMRVGQWAIAVGRTLDPGRPNLAVGILSAKDRIWGKAIQTDANVSPSNYGGPLIDIAGRVLGILVPMSPHEQSEVAGAEWYDSGIGFAVPLADLGGALERMKQGADVFPGLLGITLKAGDIYSLPAELAACQFASPAYKAGLRAGDVIVELNGEPVQRQAQLKHLLGPHYAGNIVRVAATRDGERIEVEIELIDKLQPYVHPFLGILPRRDEDGVVVRHVFAESGAAAAGIKPGDRVTSVNQQPMQAVDDLRLAIANAESGSAISVGVAREGESREVEVVLGTLPTEVPDALPPARNQPPEGDEFAAPQWTTINIVEEASECLAFIPRSYSADVPHGVVIYLRAPGDFDREELLKQWQPLCEERDLILLAPQPEDNQRWAVTELAFVRKAVDHVLTNYNIDRNRMVVFGHEAGGALAYLFAFRHRELARGLVAVDAAVPARVRPPDTDPVYPLAVLVFSAQGSRIAERTAQVIETLRQLKYPITVRELETSRPVTTTELQEVARWADALDRI